MQLARMHIRASRMDIHRYFDMTDAQLFNCSLDQLTDELSQYADTTVHIDPRPGAAFYDIVKVRSLL